MLQACDIGSPARPIRLADHVLRFSLPVFEHIARHRGSGGASTDAQRQAIVHERLERELVEHIDDDLKQIGRQGRRDNGYHVPRDLLAQHVASTFLGVLRWWLENREWISPSQANELFRALMLPTLTRALE